MSTLAVVEEIFRETRVPMSVRQIVEHAAGRLPTKSKTPDTVVARDLSMDIKKKGDESKFVRTAPGRYTLRIIWDEIQTGANTGADTEVAASNVAHPDVTPATRYETEPPATATPEAQPLVAASSHPSGDNGQSARSPEPSRSDRPTDVLAAIRSGRAGPLPARGPALAEQEKGSHGQ